MVYCLASMVGGQLLIVHLAEPFTWRCFPWRIRLITPFRSQLGSSQRRREPPIDLGCLVLVRSSDQTSCSEPCGAYMPAAQAGSLLGGAIAERCSLLETPAALYRVMFR
jgi:hypothetical protein